MDALLREIVLVFLVAGAVLVIFQRLHLPGVVGLLMAGVLIGPHGLGVVEETEQIDLMAELGIVLLMFSIGLDFTPGRIRELVHASGLGVVQMAICIVGTTMLTKPFMESWAESVFLGLMVAHTSSTLMLRIFMDRGALSSPELRLGLGISITQDLSVVPMLLAVPFLAGMGGTVGDVGLALLKVASAIAVVLAFARWVLPRALLVIMGSRSRELFIIFLATVCLGTSWATVAVGLSPALGAFLAGLAVAASPYSHQTLAEVAPFRDLLVSLFFISIGMLLDLRILLDHGGLALAAMAGVLVLKWVSGFVPVLLWGYPLRIAIVVGLAMAQIGEFAFVLSHGGHEAGLISDARFGVVVIVAVSSMLANPFLVGAGPALVRWITAIPAIARLERRRTLRTSEEESELSGHVVVAGYGLNGRTVVRALRSLGLPYVAMDLDPRAVAAARDRGERVLYGDCTRAEVLRRLHLEAARVLVIAISDPRATRQAVQVARHESPRLRILARTKYLAEIEVLHRLGADEVISEELETSLEILARVLHGFQVPRLQIEEILESFRGDAYEAFRGPAPLPQHRELLAKLLPTLQIETVVVPEGSPGTGKSLRELEVRTKTGATVVAVQRDGRMETVPAPDFELRDRDLLVLAGTPGQIRDVTRLLAPEEDRGPGLGSPTSGPSS